MIGLIRKRLRPVRLRQSGSVVLKSSSLGLVAGALAGIGLGSFHWLSGTHVAPALAAAVIAAGPVLGALAGLLRRSGGWLAAAQAVDATYGLKDRTASALDFAARPDPSPVHALQLADAAEHLEAVEPRVAAPLRLPKRALACGTVALALAVGLLAWPLRPRALEAAPVTLPQVVEQAEKIQDDLNHLQELARSEQNKELEKLVEQLREKADAMKQPGVDVREALAKISEMQAAITTVQAQFNLALVDAQLHSLGEAMAPATSLEAAGKDLIEAKFDKAAEKLDQLEDPAVDRKEAKTVQEKLKQVADTMGQVGLGQLAEAAGELAEGLGSGGEGKFKKATRALAKLVKGHDSRRKIKEILDAEFANLCECKSQCNSDKALRIRMPTRSESPSASWGAGISGNVLGKKTDRKSGRDVKELSGTPGDGPSEVETTHSPEGRQTAARGYREAYQKYRKMSEAVLDSEAIPLGHRQTIRRYFELIRPRNSGETPEAPSKGQ